MYVCISSFAERCYLIIAIHNYIVISIVITFSLAERREGVIAIFESSGMQVVFALSSQLFVSAASCRQGFSLPHGRHICLLFLLFCLRFCIFWFAGFVCILWLASWFYTFWQAGYFSIAWLATPSALARISVASLVGQRLFPALPDRQFFLTPSGRHSFSGTSYSAGYFYTFWLASCSRTVFLAALLLHLLSGRSLFPRFGGRPFLHLLAGLLFVAPSGWQSFFHFLARTRCSIL